MASDDTGAKIEALKRKYVELLETTTEMVETLQNLKKRKIEWEDEKSFLSDKLFQYEQAYPNLLETTVEERAIRAKKGAPQCVFTHGTVACKSKAMVSSRFCAAHSPTLVSPTIKLCEYKDLSGKQCTVSIPRNVNARYCPAHKQWSTEQTYNTVSLGQQATLQRMQAHMMSPSSYGVFNRMIPPSTLPPSTLPPSTQPPSTQPPATTSVNPSLLSGSPMSTIPPATTMTTPPVTMPGSSVNTSTMRPTTYTSSMYQQQQQLQQQLQQQQMLYQKQQQQQQQQQQQMYGKTNMGPMSGTGVGGYAYPPTTFLQGQMKYPQSPLIVTQTHPQQHMTTVKVGGPPVTSMSQSHTQSHSQHQHPSLSHQTHPQSYTPQVHSSQGHPSQGHPSQGHPSQGHPSQGHLSQGHLSQGHLSQSHLSQGHPSQGPSQSHSLQGHPSQGYTPHHQNHPQTHPPQNHYSYSQSHIQHHQIQPQTQTHVQQHQMQQQSTMVPQQVSIQTFQSHFHAK
eukprot:TRINITY_DN3290_c2_g1_i2.p1 TRINITY_DN3290_c2_g1~~TRINITY_DN3290_c2_g1_i2.p1  ORF type:complete len:513 (-),score=77.48 TRINITY_DN3290_c2_g1_i2:105-1622(-)